MTQLNSYSKDSLSNFPILSIVTWNVFRCLLGILLLGPQQKCEQPSFSSNEPSIISVEVSCSSDVIEYEIQYKYSTTPLGDWKSETFDATGDQPFVLRNLVPFTVYAIRVREVHGAIYGERVVAFSDPVTIRTAAKRELSYWQTAVPIYSWRAFIWSLILPIFDTGFCKCLFLFLAPVKPGSPHLSSPETSVSTISFVAPNVDDQNGPIRYLAVHNANRLVEVLVTDRCQLCRLCGPFLWGWFDTSIQQASIRFCSIIRWSLWIW